MIHRAARAGAISMLGALLLVWTGAAAPAAQSAGADGITVEVWIGELDRLDSALAALSSRDSGTALPLLGSLPRQWTVTEDARTFTVPSDWLRRDLAAWHAQPTDEGLEVLRDRLRSLRAVAAADPGRSPQGSEARARLETILAEPEFRAVHGPGWFDRVMQRAVTWLLDWLAMTVGSSVVPTVTRSLVAGVVGLAIVLALLALRRSLRRAVALDTLGRTMPPPPRRPWPHWLDGAREEAARGEWREAVRRAYWCGVAFLETQGAWRADPSRTPREYVRLLPATDRRVEPLAALTSLLERVWYGVAPADRERYDEALSLLEQLGCPSR